MAHLRHDVIGIDVDPGKVQSLAAAQAAFFEPGLDEILVSATNTGG
jgi:UDPglucose 6-dehydrogenase